ncbi:MAG: hypothetical protein LC775_03350, partial [Acidobacteria bacterium]|nr:hypothetical protein [Acidobacteriota bacterium]
GPDTGGPTGPSEADRLRIAVPRDVGPLNIFVGAPEPLAELVYDKLVAPSPYVAEPRPWLAYQLAIFSTYRVSAGLITCLMCLVVICKLVNATSPLARSWMPTSLPAKKCAAVLSRGRLLPTWYAATRVA